MNYPKFGNFRAKYLCVLFFIVLLFVFCNAHEIVSKMKIICTYIVTRGTFARHNWKGTKDKRTNG